LTGDTGIATLGAQTVGAAMGSEPKRSEPPSEVTQLLQGWRGGDPAALDALVSLVYKELRRLAHFQLRDERQNHTLAKLGTRARSLRPSRWDGSPQWESRTHFFAIAAQLMRQILVDYARCHRSAKRGGSVCKLSLDDAAAIPRQKALDVVALDEALQELAKIDPRQSRVVELRFFGGLTLEEISAVLEIAPATVQRDWTSARAWLHRQISRGSTA
jgi:RNA polymerase sigma factor (TIGR02999 family)